MKILATLLAILMYAPCAAQSYLVSGGPNAGDGYDGGIEPQYATQTQDNLPAAPQVRASSPGTVSMTPSIVAQAMQYQVVEVQEQVYVPAKVRYETVEEPVTIMVQKTVPVIEQEARIETRTVQRNICAPQAQVQSFAVEQQCVNCQPQVQVQSQQQCVPQVQMRSTGACVECQPQMVAGAAPQMVGMFLESRHELGSRETPLDVEFSDRGHTTHRFERDNTGAERVTFEKLGLLQRIRRNRENNRRTGAERNFVRDLRDEH